jgi:putative nucleotidyltransferase with HDIG domain
MFNRPSLPRAGVLYVTTVIAIGSTVFLLSVYELADLATRDGFPAWYVLAGLALLSGSVTVPLQSVSATISISETFVFTSVIMYGPAAGAVIVALDGLVMSIWLSKGRRQLHRVAFNMAGPTLSIWLAGQLYYLLTNLTPAFEQSQRQRLDELPHIILPLAAFAIAHFLINSSLIAFAVAIETKRPTFEIWKTEFLWLCLNYFGAASITALALPMGLTGPYFGIIIPLLLILYFTFKIPMARMQDAMKHLNEIKTLHSSTIDALAMAVDAKDQVTHGHIRRVQTYAVGLARAVGVSDPGMLRAIEASALLHDMGKLAIPEHILNKPGKLTAAEFEKIKQHASLGADLLSAIAFPYPVIPIVRHHHENWDGSGYPSGIHGTQIPIGARILSVVDCYDALTSDRPYRPKLSDEAATSILLQRRGTMYDPLVVDTFVRIHRSITPPEALTGAQSATYADIARLSSPEIRPAELGRSQSPFDKAVAELASLISSRHSLHSTVERANTFLLVSLKATGAAAGLIAKYDAGADDLEVLTAAGLGNAQVKGIRIPLGEHLTGWVGANLESIVNSDAALDLNAFAPGRTLPLTTCLSVPLLGQAKCLIGVMSLYASADFTKDHVDAVRALSSSIADAVSELTPNPRSYHQTAS